MKERTSEAGALILKDSIFGKVDESKNAVDESSRYCSESGLEMKSSLRLGKKTRDWMRVGSDCFGGMISIVFTFTAFILPLPVTPSHTDSLNLFKSKFCNLGNVQRICVAIGYHDLETRAQDASV